jgi:hypothetical protein
MVKLVLATGTSTILQKNSVDCSRTLAMGLAKVCVVLSNPVGQDEKLDDGESSTPSD